MNAKIGMSKKALAVAAIVLGLGVAGSAQAVHGVPPGETTANALTPFPAGFSTANLLASSVTTTDSQFGIFNGTFRSAVYQNIATMADQNDPETDFIAGQVVLDFVYQFTNNGAGAAGTAPPVGIGRLTMFNFAAGVDPNLFDILVWDQSPGIGGIFLAGTQEADANEVDRGLNGATVGFDFGTAVSTNKIDANETSFLILLRVNVSAFTQGLFSAINGDTATVVSFQPTLATQIPEPATLLLLGVGLAVLGWFGKRRRTH